MIPTQNDQEQISERFLEAAKHGDVETIQVWHGQQEEGTKG
jgi:hypothetical protein